MPQECEIDSTGWFEEIKFHRNKFLSQKAKHTFSGYAHAQLKRMQGHKKWLDNPPNCPYRGDYADQVAYDAKFKEWRHYEEWVENRNPERAVLEKKFNLDTKHATHLVRLLLMCYEILTEGTLTVKRENDIVMFKSIREGRWDYEELVKYAEDMDHELTELAEKSSLPKQPDRNFLDDLCAGLVNEIVFE